MATLRCSCLLAAVSACTALVPAAMPRVATLSTTAAGSVSRFVPENIVMINLFGNTEESRKQREELSLRSARPGDRKVTFRKPNSATQGIELGLKFRESFGKAVYIDAILPNSEAARLEKQGKLKVGDEVTMISATFGDEMWSARNVGKYRLEKSIAVRQGMTISFVVENSDDNSKRARKAAAEKAAAEAKKMSKLQAQLTEEVQQEKKKGSFFGGLF